jgi:hypothetical protein
MKSRAGSTVAVQSSQASCLLLGPPCTIRLAARPLQLHTHIATVGGGPLAVFTLPPTPTPTTLLQQRCSPTACRGSLRLRVKRVGGVTEGERGRIEDSRGAVQVWHCRPGLGLPTPGCCVPYPTALPPGRVRECLVAWFGQWLWLGNNCYSTVPWIAQYINLLHLWSGVRGGV